MEFEKHSSLQNSETTKSVKIVLQIYSYRDFSQVSSKFALKKNYSSNKIVWNFKSSNLAIN